MYIHLILTVILALGLSAGTARAAEEAKASASDAPSLLIADFDSANKPNNVGGDFGSWNYAPNDETQGCWDSFEALDHKESAGAAIMMEYDVKSPNPAFCGFWMKLGGVDVTNYDTLSLWIKGEDKQGYTSRFKVELRNKLGGRAIFTISGVSGNWQEFNIPVKRTRSIKDWSKMEEMTIVFDDILATKKVGKIYLDQVAFKKLGTEEIAPAQEAAAPSQVS